MLKEIEGYPGLFEMVDIAKMPADPNDFVMRIDYLLPNTYGTGEKEEAASRFIKVCQKLGRWCGVSMRHLFTIIVDEMENHESRLSERNTIIEQNRIALDNYNSARTRFIFLSIVTLGIYPLVTCNTKPIRPRAKKVPIIKTPMSFVYTFGPDFIKMGLQQLVKENMLRIERHDDGYDVFFPTPELLKPIDQYQR